MNILRDDWTPLFQKLNERVSPQGRRRLLFQLIGELENISVLNFGESGIARPLEWPRLKEKYAIEYHDADQTPTLILSGDLKNSFVHEIGTDSAKLTNTSEYASDHQEGDPSKNLPARPYFPVTPDGQELTAYAKERLLEVLDSHFSPDSME